MNEVDQEHSKDPGIPARLPDVGLALVCNLLDRLHSQRIVYCHFKSNQHVSEGMLGETDLDVLVVRDALVEVTEILSQTGYKRFKSVPASDYPAVEDYLGMDGVTGQLVHLHLHYRLVVGEPHLKGYRLPWEDIVLSNRVLAAPYGIYTACPEVEMILLVVRAALKLRMRNRVLVRLGRPYPSGDMLREYLWLKERIDLDKLQGFALTMLGEEASVRLLALVREDTLSYESLLKFRRVASLVLKHHRSYGYVHGTARRWFREANWAVGVISKRYLHLPIPLRRVPTGGGVVVALLGCDGSGKSTQLKEITKWLSWKLDVLPVYLGSGDGPSSLLRWPLKLALQVVKRGQGAVGPSMQAASRASMEARAADPWYKRIGRLPWALLLALEKRQKLMTITRARNRGMIVVCDRYPQNQALGFNDGPLLSTWANNDVAWMRRIATWERSCYALAEVIAPDLVVKLHVTPQVALARKPEMSITEYRRRVETIRHLQFGMATRVADIDADQPLEQVALQIKHRVWERL